MGLSSVASTIKSLAEPKNYSKISKSQYNFWRSGYLFDALKNLRYGQSFCNKFGITDNILFFETRAENCHRYILENYIKYCD